MKIELCASCGGRPVLKETTLDEKFRWNVSCYGRLSRAAMCGYAFGTTAHEAIENWNGQFAFKPRQSTSFEYEIEHLEEANDM